MTALVEQAQCRQLRAVDRSVGNYEEKDGYVLGI